MKAAGLSCFQRMGNAGRLAAVYIKNDPKIIWNEFEVRQYFYGQDKINLLQKTEDINQIFQYYFQLPTVESLKLWCNGLSGVLGICAG
jgi:hypothetical protein